jgi:hypothetical protein
MLAPTNLFQLNCKPGSPKSLHLNWIKTNTTDCPVEEYLLQYVVVSDSHSNASTSIALNAKVEGAYQLGNLRPWTTYAVSVTPLNSGGLGLKSNIVHCKTEQSCKEVPRFFFVSYC